MPLATTATYSGPNDPCTVDLTAPSVFTGISALYWSQPIYVAKPEDPWTEMVLDPTNGIPPFGLDPSIHHNNPVAGMRVPIEATPALPTYQAEPLTDAHLTSSTKPTATSWRCGAPERTHDLTVVG